MVVLKFFAKYIVSAVGFVFLLFGIFSAFTDTREIVSWLSPFGVQPIHFAFFIFSIAAIYIIVIQGVSIRRWERVKPKLYTKLLPFPLSGWRFDGKAFAPEIGYAKIAVENLGGFIENCISKVTNIYSLSITKGKIQILPQAFTADSLRWDTGENKLNIANDGVSRYINLAYIDQNQLGKWQLAIEGSQRQDYGTGWWKIDVIISSESEQANVLKVEVALGLGDRESPPSGLTLWPWDEWHKAMIDKLKKESYQKGSPT